MPKEPKTLLSALLTTDDQDILDYVTGTVEQCVEDGETSAEALTEALSDLLISYELAPDEDAASAICVSLSEQLSGGEPVASKADAPAKLLSAPMSMGKQMRADEDEAMNDALTSRAVNVDALGNSCSMAARANAASAAASAAKEPSKTVAEAKTEPEGASGPAFGLLHATSVSKAEQTARDSAELDASRREREAACERYLLSKAAGGSRDVAIKGLILLAPTGKPLIDGGEDGSAKLQLVAGRRYGLVGRNGTGKSTLLKAIASYEISGFPQHLKVVHVEQDPRHDLDASPLSTVLGYDLERSLLRRRLADLGAKLEEAVAAQDVATSGEKGAADRHAARVQKRCEEAEALLAELGDEEAAEAKAASILAGLQFSTEMMSAPLRTLSGGWRMRVTLAAALFVPCDILLLDEPTNHLDFPALSWLTKWLQDKCKATLLIVSHDRGFLDDVVTDVVQLRGRNLTSYRGDITSYVKNVDEQKREQKRRYEAQQAERKHMQEMIDKYDPSKNSRDDNKKNKRHAGVLAQAKQRDKQLSKMEEEGLIADPDAKSDEATIALSFPPPPPLKKPLLASLDGASFRYPTAKGILAKGAPLLRELRVSVSLGERIGVLGPNGAGKSTLLHLLTQQLQPTSGEAWLNRGAKWAIFAQHHIDQLDLNSSPQDFLASKFAGAKEVEIRSRLGRFGMNQHAMSQPMTKLSGGQKSRVVLCAISWAEPTFLILDEPTNHLDMETVDVLATAVREFAGAVLVVSHDTYFLRHAANKFWSLRDGGVTEFQDLEGAARHARAKKSVELD